MHLKSGLAVALTTMVVATNGGAMAQKKYDAGASDTEIKIGNIMPYSGPVSSSGLIGTTEAAYFEMINEHGGINGRKIKFVSYDDGYSPPKAVEQVRRLVESDEVLLVFNSFGTPTNTAIQKYLNAKRVPQLFVASGAAKWNDPKHFPWTMGWPPSYRDEARIYAKYLLKEKPDAKIAILYQNDDFGKDYLNGFRDGLGDRADAMIAIQESYEVSEPTIESHVVKLKSSGADTFVNFATPKFAAQAIKKVGELGWAPLHIVTGVSISVGAVMRPAGFEYGQGVVSASYLKDATDPQWGDDPYMKKWSAFMDKFMPGADRSNIMVVYGYGAAQTLQKVLEMCGDDLTRENVMRQATSLKDFQSDVTLPGITINTGPTDFAPMKQVRMMRFKGEKWELFGDVISSVDGTK